MRGVYKKIIEVNDTQNDYFEKAIFIVKEERRQSSPDVLREKAGEYLRGIGAATLPRKRRRFRIHKGMVVFAGVLCVAAVLLYMFFR